MRVPGLDVVIKTINFDQEFYRKDINDSARINNEIINKYNTKLPAEQILGLYLITLSKHKLIPQVYQ